MGFAPLGEWYAFPAGTAGCNSSLTIPLTPFATPGPGDRPRALEFGGAEGSFPPRCRLAINDRCSRAGKSGLNVDNCGVGDSARE